MDPILPAPTITMSFMGAPVLGDIFDRGPCEW
jgi:hypothetical protein